MSQSKVWIIRREDKADIEAVLLGGLKPTDLDLIERAWLRARQEIMDQLLARGIPRSEWPQSLHWNWGTKANLLQLLSHEGWAIKCEGDYQGVLMADTASHFADLEEDRGKPLLYIEYLELAPWNWEIEVLGQQKFYSHIGTALFQKAVEHSEELGFAGRIGLHSLSRAEFFYEQACGMTRFGPDPNKQGLVYFELSRTAAAIHLKPEEK